jgi:hypothetical protein
MSMDMLSVETVHLQYLTEQGFDVFLIKAEHNLKDQCHEVLTSGFFSP